MLTEKEIRKKISEITSSALRPMAQVKALLQLRQLLKEQLIKVKSNSLQLYLWDQTDSLIHVQKLEDRLEYLCDEIRDTAKKVLKFQNRKIGFYSGTLRNSQLYLFEHIDIHSNSIEPLSA